MTIKMEQGQKKCCFTSPSWSAHQPIGPLNHVYFAGAFEPFRTYLQIVKHQGILTPVIYWIHRI
jgi:hypothetical protein